MRLLIIPFLVFLVSCSPKADYFKITLTDELNPAGFFAEPIEVNNLGKVLYKTHKHNENKDLYQNLFFGELNEGQMDSVKLFVDNLSVFPIDFNIDTTLPAYKISITQTENGRKIQRIIVGNHFDEDIIQLVHYIQQLPAATKRYDLKGNYFFDIDNICLGTNVN